jgi:hypothetical protein
MGARRQKTNVRSVGADVSEKVFEQHVDFFRVHVLAHVFDPHDRDVGIPKAAMSHTINPRELRPTHWTQSSTLLTLFQTSLRIGSTLSAAGLLSQQTVPKEANSWLRGIISSVVWGRERESEMLGGAKAMVQNSQAFKTKRSLKLIPRG